jgi:AraC-like DNA-binding protein
MELLDDILGVCRFQVALYCRWENYAPWGIAIQASTSAQFHAMRKGHCWIRLESDRAVLVEEGDFVVVPHGHAHDLTDAPESPAVPVQEIIARVVPSARRVVCLEGGGPFTEMICGACHFGNPSHRSLFGFLPKVLHLRAKENVALQPILDLADRELGEPRPASPIVLARLGDILFIEAIRLYAAGLRPGNGSWLGAALDPNIGTVLKAIHANPSNHWTVGDLAAKAAMSRSSFANRFRELVGVPVRVHITRLRMVRATALLEDPDLSIGEIAYRVGYESVASFNRAFCRELGVPPGEFRTRLKNLSAKVAQNV